MTGQNRAEASQQGAIRPRASSGHSPRERQCPFRRQRQPAPFCTGFAVREAVASDHDRNQTGNLRNGTGEKVLDSSKTGVDGEPPCASAATGMTKSRQRAAVARAHFDRRRGWIGRIRWTCDQRDDICASGSTSKRLLVAQN